MLTTVPCWHVRIEFEKVEPVRFKVAEYSVSNVLQVVGKIIFASEPTAIVISREDQLNRAEPYLTTTSAYVAERAR